MALFIHSQKLKTTLHRVYYLQSAVVSYLEGQGWGTTRDLDWLPCDQPDDRVFGSGLDHECLVGGLVGRILIRRGHDSS